VSCFILLGVVDEAKQCDIRHEDQRINPSISIHWIDTNKPKASEPCRKQGRTMVMEAREKQGD
jgi:hypothetical protein